MKKKCFILDSSNIIYRSFYGIKPMYTSTGIVTNALFGFCKTLLKIIKEQKPDYIVAAWEGGIQKRLEICKNYKQNRQKTPDDLLVQRDYVLEFLSSIEVPVLFLNNYEADDIIVGLVNEYTNRECDVYIVSSDKDFHYLLSDSIFLYNPGTHLSISKADLISIYQKELKSDQFFLYYALIGDASDNVTGVKGIGEKSALKLLEKYTTLDELYKNYESDPAISQSIKKLLAQGKEAAYISDKLIRPLELPGTIQEKAVLFNLNEEKMYHFFRKFDFFSLIPKNFLFDKNKEAMDIQTPSSIIYAKSTFKTYCAKDENYQELCKEFDNAQLIAVDTETTGGNKKSTTMVGFSLCFKAGQAWYIPLNHGVETGLSTENCRKILSLLSHTSANIIMHNALFDLHILSNEGVKINGKIFDTMVAAHLLKTNEDDRIGLKDLSNTVLQLKMDSFIDIIKQGPYKNFSDVPLQIASEYAAADAHQTFLLYIKFNEKLKETRMTNLFYEIEMPLLKILYKMECIGIGVKWEILKEQGEIILKRLSKLKEEIEFDAEEKNINIHSNAQISNLLFKKLDIKSNKKTSKTGAFSTDQDALEKIIDAHPIIKKIIDYRGLASTKKRCIDNMYEHIRSDNRIYASFNQTHVATGRLSSSDPNMQNIPKDPLDKSYSIRSAFTPSNGNLFISLDYSQIELRVLAYLSQDQSLIETFIHNKDVHTQTAAYINKIEIDKVTEIQRQFAKKINFGIIYGLTSYGLSQNLQISLNEARDYLEEYKKLYPRVFEWIEEIKNNALINGYADTHFGRRRYIRGAADRNQNIRAEAGRIAVNTTVQGTAAELVKIGMIKSAELLKNYDRAHILLQIHDELLIEAPNENAYIIGAEIQNQLETAVEWNVPIKTSLQIGSTWAEVS